MGKISKFLNTCLLAIVLLLLGPGTLLCIFLGFPYVVVILWVGVIGFFTIDPFSMRDYEKARRAAHARNGPAQSAIAFVCPKCDRNYSGPASLASSNFICRSCKHPFNVAALPKVVQAPEFPTTS